VCQILKTQGFSVVRQRVAAVLVTCFKAVRWEAGKAACALFPWG